MTVTFIGRSSSRSVPGRDDGQPVRLVELAGDLGDELRRADADGAGEPAADLAHPRPQLLAERRHRPHLEVGQAGRVEVDERLVEGQRLHEGRGGAQHLHHPRAGLAVGVEAAGQEGRVRAAGPRLARRHRRADAVHPGLVRRRRDDAATRRCRRR